MKIYILKWDYASFKSEVSEKVSDLLRKFSDVYVVQAESDTIATILYYILKQFPKSATQYYSDYVYLKTFYYTVNGPIVQLNVRKKQQRAVKTNGK